MFSSVKCMTGVSQALVAILVVDLNHSQIQALKIGTVPTTATIEEAHQNTMPMEYAKKQLENLIYFKGELVQTGSKVEIIGESKEVEDKIADRLKLKGNEEKLKGQNVLTYVKNNYTVHLASHEGIACNYIWKGDVITSYYITFRKHKHGFLDFFSELIDFSAPLEIPEDNLQLIDVSAEDQLDSEEKFLAYVKASHVFHRQNQGTWSTLTVSANYYTYWYNNLLLNQIKGGRLRALVYEYDSPLIGEIVTLDRESRYKYETKTGVCTGGSIADLELKIKSVPLEVADKGNNVQYEYIPLRNLVPVEADVNQSELEIQAPDVKLFLNHRRVDQVHTNVAELNSRAQVKLEKLIEFQARVKKLRSAGEGEQKALYILAAEEQGAVIAEKSSSSLEFLISLNETRNQADGEHFAVTLSQYVEFHNCLKVEKMLKQYLTDLQKWEQYLTDLTIKEEEGLVAENLKLLHKVNAVMAAEYAKKRQIEKEIESSFENIESDTSEDENQKISKLERSDAADEKARNKGTQETIGIIEQMLPLSVPQALNTNSILVKNLEDELVVIAREMAAVEAERKAAVDGISTARTEGIALLNQQMDEKLATIETAFEGQQAKLVERHLEYSSLLRSAEDNFANVSNIDLTLLQSAKHEFTKLDRNIDLRNRSESANEGATLMPNLESDTSRPNSPDQQE